MKSVRIEKGIANFILMGAACLLASCDKGGIAQVLNDGNRAEKAGLGGDAG